MSKRTYRNHTHPTGAKFVSAYYYVKEQRRTLLSQRNGPAGAAFDRVANDYGLPRCHSCGPIGLYPESLRHPRARIKLFTSGRPMPVQRSKDRNEKGKERAEG